VRVIDRAPEPDVLRVFAQPRVLPLEELRFERSGTEAGDGHLVKMRRGHPREIQAAVDRGAERSRRREPDCGGQERHRQQPPLFEAPASSGEADHGGGHGEQDDARTGAQQGRKMQDHERCANGTAAHEQAQRQRRRQPGGGEIRVAERAVHVHPRTGEALRPPAKPRERIVMQELQQDDA
jgi:hypothetical protein